ncbi:MAG: SMC-Scp complex subunit ScpB [Acidobacteria bacterium]|nr:SMC-Scp complex subunit ScpB [Acidobacteriota bacterium]
MEKERLKAIVEAILFAADEPVSVEKLVEVLPEVPREELEVALREMVADFNGSRGGVEIREIAGGFRISTRPEYHEWIRTYLKTRPSAKLSLASLETLAVIAYKQPVTLPEILQIRSIKSTSAIKTLLEKKLIVSRGRKNVVGRPILYGTSKEFLIHFGLKDLSELPTLEEFEEIMGQE